MASGASGSPENWACSHLVLANSSWHPKGWLLNCPCICQSWLLPLPAVFFPTRPGEARTGDLEVSDCSGCGMPWSLGMWHQGAKQLPAFCRKAGCAGQGRGLRGGIRQCCWCCSGDTAWVLFACVVSQSRGSKVWLTGREPTGSGNDSLTE